MHSLIYSSQQINKVGNTTSTSYIRLDETCSRLHNKRSQDSKIFKLSFQYTKFLACYGSSAFMKHSEIYCTKNARGMASRFFPSSSF